MSQGKSWIEKGNERKMNSIFSCKNHNDLISEFLFLISNLHSAQDDFINSNFYSYLSHYLNPKFHYNLSLVAENLYSNEEFDRVKKILQEFKKEDDLPLSKNLIFSEPLNETLSLMSTESKGVFLKTSTPSCAD